MEITIYMLPVSIDPFIMKLIDYKIILVIEITNTIEQIQS